MTTALGADEGRAFGRCDPLTGVGRYNLELARELAAMPDIELSYIRGVRLLDALPEPTAESQVVPALRDRLSSWRLPTEMYRRLLGHARARALRHQPRGTILHGANYYLPAYRGPSVVTIHDVSVFLLPHHHRVDRVRYMRREVELALRRSALVLTVSEFSRTEIARVLGYPVERIRVTPLGHDPRFHPDASNAAVLRKLHPDLAPGSYSLFVGTVEPRKNLEALLAAYERLPPALRRRHPLVLCGYRGWGSEALHARLGAAVRDGWLVYLGYAPDEALPALFAGARVFVYPSLYEGFGLPVLEAMASGVPVVRSAIPALDEVAGEVGVSFQPQDVEALTDALAMGLQNDGWREETRLRGLDRAARFSWRRCAELTREAYRELAAA